MGEWKADVEVTTEENWNSWNTAFLWIIPAKVGGIWKLGNGELNLNQEYQYFSGTYSTGSRSFSLTDGKLEGDAISFMVNGDLYTGRVFEKVMKGTVVNAASGTKSDWTASR